MNLSPDAWKKVSFTTHLLVHYVYLSTMLLNGALFLWLPKASRLTYEEYRQIFLGLIGISVLTFPLCVIVYRRYLSRKNLETVFKAMGLGAASSTFKTGCILAACIGDMTGVFGAVFFAYSRDQSGLLFFLGGWAIQYGAAILWLKRGKAILQNLIVNSIA